MKKITITLIALCSFMPYAFGMKPGIESGKIRFILSKVINKTDKDIVFSTPQYKYLTVKPYETLSTHQEIPHEHLNIGSTGRLDELSMMCSPREGATCALIQAGRTLLNQEHYEESTVGKNADVLIDVILEGNNLEQSTIKFIGANRYYKAY